MSPHILACIFNEGKPYLVTSMAPITHPPVNLYMRTRDLLKTDPRGVLDIHKASGIPFYWLRKVHGGEIKDPGVNRIQELYEFLTGAPLLK